MIEQAKLCYLNRNEFGEYILSLQLADGDQIDVRRFQITRGHVGNIIADGVRYLLSDIATVMLVPSSISTTDDIQ